MNEIIIINNQELPVKEYDGQRVVTFKDIDMIHKRPEGDFILKFKEDSENE